MDKNSVAEALRALAGSEGRSETARLRDVFTEVEAALAAGVSRSAILQTLHEQGFTMTMKSFEGTVYRLRKQARTGKAVKPYAERVHAPLSSAAENRAASPQSVTPKGEAEDQSNLTLEERREKRADQFIKPELTNTLLSKILKDKKP